MKSSKLRPPGTPGNGSRRDGAAGGGATLRPNVVKARKELIRSRNRRFDRRDAAVQQRELRVGVRETELSTREKTAEDVAAIDALLKTHMEKLREANEHLLITAVEAQMMAELARQAQDRVGHLAHHDSLTGLPNRVMLTERLSQAIALAKRQQTRIAVLFVDLDRFKTINDSLGHAVGDSLLQLVAQRLQGTLRDSDTVSRHGGDEFVILLPEIGDRKNIEAMANTICTKVSAPYFLSDQNLRIGATVGISIYPADGTDAATLIQNADVAMYDAKDAGGNQYRFFQQQMNERAVVRQRVEGELHQALERHEFELFLQPLVELSSGNISGVEALIRWRHPVHGLLEPASFIPIAEACGVIIPIGKWVLDEACRHVRQWQDLGLDPPNIAVNVSALQFKGDNFGAVVAAALAKYQIAPKLLALELTETALMDNVESTLAMLQKLKSIGVKVSIDDFGTGYSSLAYLRRFPIGELKIDMSFIRDVATNSDDAAIVLAVINMAHSLKLHVIAEGVETEAQLRYLRHHHCDRIQGHYCSRALPAPQFTELLRQNTCLLTPGAMHSHANTLLIVDDDPVVVNMLSDLCDGEGYRILTAGSAAEGFAMLARHPVDVIVAEQCVHTVSRTAGLGDKELSQNGVRTAWSESAEPPSLVEGGNQAAVFRFFTQPCDHDALRESLKEAFRLVGHLHLNTPC